LKLQGVDPRKHGIHQLSGAVELNGEVVEDFNFFVAPNPKAQITAEALAVAGVTEEQIKAYPEMRTIYRAFVNMLAKYADRFIRRIKYGLWATITGLSMMCFSGRGLIRTVIVFLTHGSGQTLWTL